MVKRSAYNRKTHKRKTNWRRTQKKGGFLGFTTSKPKPELKEYKSLANGQITSPEIIANNTTLSGTPDTCNLQLSGARNMNYRITGINKYIKQLANTLNAKKIKYQVSNLPKDSNDPNLNVTNTLTIIDTDIQPQLLKSCVNVEKVNDITANPLYLKKNNENIKIDLALYKVEIIPESKFGGKRKSRRGGSTCKTAIVV